MRKVARQSYRRDIMNNTREGIVIFFSVTKSNTAIGKQIQVPDARPSANWQNCLRGKQRFKPFLLHYITLESITSFDILEYRAFALRTLQFYIKYFAQQRALAD